MGCAASSTVNTADDINPIIESTKNEQRSSPKPTPDSGDLDINHFLNDGDQTKKNQDMIDEINFHNSPAMVCLDQRSMGSTTKSVSNASEHCNKSSVENISKSNENILSSPLVNASRLESEKQLSKDSHPVSLKHDKSSSKNSTVNKIGDVENENNLKSQNEINNLVKRSSRIYQMTSSQESIRSLELSPGSNVVYKPTVSSDDEQKSLGQHSTILNESRNDSHFRKNSLSVMSESKSMKIQPSEYWNEENKKNSNANSLNNVQYEKSSRNSRLSHTYTGSGQSPFFDSLNHGNTNYDNEENQNHDEVSETLNEKLLLGTGDSEQWINEKEKYQDVVSISSIKSKNIKNDGSVPLYDQNANLSGTGDKDLNDLQSKNDSSLVDNLDRCPSKASNNRSENCVNNLKNEKQIICEVNSCSNTEYLKTAEVNDSNCEETVIGMSLSPMEINSSLNDSVKTPYKEDQNNDESKEKCEESVVEIKKMNKENLCLSENKSPVVVFPHEQDEVLDLKSQSG